MKKGSHKNQIIITTLALLLAVVGYISYDNRDTFMNAKDVLSTEIEAVNGKADTKESKECEEKDEYAKYTLSALAELCGFSSRASFFRYFKKATNITPNEYIRSIGKNNE